MRREYLALIVFGCVLALAGVGWQVLFSAPEPAGVTIAAVSGNVQQVTPTGSTPATVGASVAARDRLVAGPDGNAVLAFGDEARLTLDASSSIKVVSVDDAGVRVELDGGRVSATVRPGGRQLAIGADGREVTAEDADFTVARGEDGTLAVAADRGSVKTNLPGVSTIGAGQKVVAPRDRQALVSPTNDALLLSVVWPEQSRTRAAEVSINGTTEPGARVIFDGAGGPVTVLGDADGRFSATVALREGENTLRAHATNALGQVAELRWDVVRDTRPPSISVELRP